MRNERKQTLMYSFPAVPYYVEEQMKGKGALNFCVFLTNGHELFVRCFHRYKNGELAERQRYVFAKDGAVRYIFNEWQTPAWRVASKFREPLFASEYYPFFAADVTARLLTSRDWRTGENERFD